MRRVLAVLELLSTIFLHCILEDREQPISTETEEWPWSLRLMEGPTRSYPRLSAKRAPLILAHVCRSWRRTALGTPQLWTRLYLDLSDGTKAALPRNKLSALKFWMEKSRALPVSICLTLGRSNLYGSNIWNFNIDIIRTRFDSLLLEVVEELFKHAHRWENMIVNLPRSSLSQFYSSLDRSYPHLKIIALIPTQRSSANDDGRDLSIRSAPELKTLVLSGNFRGHYIFVPDGISPSLQSMELTSMEMRFTPCMDGCRIRELVLKGTSLSKAGLAKFPSMFPLLEELAVMTSSGQRARRDSDASEGTIVLDRLIKLRVGFLAQNPFPLSCITTPSLKYLAVNEAFGERPSCRERMDLSFEYDILRFLERSKAPIETFKFASRTQSGLALGPMLRELPSLVALQVEHNPIHSTAMEALKDPMVCPSLLSIYNKNTFNDEDTAPPSKKSILELIAKRCRKRKKMADDGGHGRVYVKEIALPVSDDVDSQLRRSKIFKEAELVWKNTFLSSSNPRKSKSLRNLE